mgnify:CR=1 FL=1
MVGVNAAIWSHPWDLVDEGPAKAANRLAALGIDEVNLATTMHSVQTLNPHNPERKTFFADASEYFQPDWDRYGEITPDVNETMGEDDWLAEIAAGFEGTPVDLNSWGATFHSSRQGQRHPDATLTSPFGDSLVFGLCPSNPAVQEFGIEMTGDLADRDIFETIEMELADYQYGTGYGWHHQEFFTELGPLGEFLFGLCFCEHCRANAAEAGVDVGAARESARDALNARFEGGLAADTDVGGWLAEHPTVREYADVRQETLAALVPLALFGLSAYLYFVRHMDLRDSVLIWTFWGLISLGLARAGPATPIYDEPLDRKRMAVGVLTFALGVLCFTPVPFELLSV